MKERSNRNKSRNQSNRECINNGEKSVKPKADSLKVMNYRQTSSSRSPEVGEAHEGSMLNGIYTGCRSPHLQTAFLVCH